MKNDDLFDLSEYLDESYIEEVGRMRMSNDIKGYDGQNSDIICINKNSRRRLPRAAAAVIAFACVLALSGGVVWAMTNTGLKEFFFNNSDKEFNELYTNGGKEYNIGEHKIVYEGSIYDKGVEQICLYFSVWDAQGQPVDLPAELEEVKDSSYELYSNDYTEATFTELIPYKIGDDIWGLLIDGAKDAHISTNGNGIYFTISRFDLDHFNGYRYMELPEYQDFTFTILNKDEINRLNKELSEIIRVEERDIEKEIPMEYDPDARVWYKQIDDYAGIHAEVVKIINKYDMKGVEGMTSTAQVVQIDNLKLTIGRMSLIMEYGINDSIVDNFTIIREDGTRTEFRLSEEYCDQMGNPTDIRLNWMIDGVQNYFLGGGASINKGIALVYNFGYILGNDEKVKIEVNGKIYE